MSERSCYTRHLRIRDPGLREAIGRMDPEARCEYWQMYAEDEIDRHAMEYHPEPAEDGLPF